MTRLILLLSCTAAFFFFVGINQFAQTKMQMPARMGRVNDSAGVINEKTRQELEGLLENVKQKTGIEFVIATVESTSGQDIFDYSRRLALNWDIGARSSVRKSLLLVLAVNEKESFTQFSKSVQNTLPEAVLGEMTQRMRTLVAAGHFNEALKTGLQYFVSSMAQKLGLNAEDFDKTPAVSAADIPAPDNTSGKRTDKAAAAVTKPAVGEAIRARVVSSADRDESTSSKAKKPGASVDDDAESEEVELTLTLPLEARVVKLKAFLESHPDSKSKPRATELLVSAHAALGDERLKNGDSPGGVEQLMLAINDAPLNSSEKLFSGVISQIPINLYLRGERSAATSAAQTIEAKFGGDPKRLLAVSGFYVAIEQGSEATRSATKAVSLAPDLAEAHLALGLALHISLRLDDAAGEYKRALELDPNSKSARRGLADLSRASGKTEEALALYRQQIIAEPTDKAAQAGLILSLLDLGRTDEAKSELKKALETDPQNLPLLAGAAYWFAAHNDGELALRLGSKAAQIEPRYTWSHVALARALVSLNKPLEAERALRFARQYGNFPTLDYELASALASAGLYQEASEILMQSFSMKDGQIEARLAGRVSARSPNFTELLAPERRASIFQPVAADTESNAKILKTLLMFSTFTNPENNGGTINQEAAIAAAREFASGDDNARVYRQLYAASRLLQTGIGFQVVYELAEAARNSADAGMAVPVLTLAVQADEYREIRARAIAAGGTPDIPEAPRNVLSNLLRGRIEDLSGWALFNQDKLEEAVGHLKRAANILPEGTPTSRTTWWHLGAALDRLDKKEEALDYYIKAYNAGARDSFRRTAIEQLYRKINGSLAGLDERIGPDPVTTAVNVQTPASSPVSTDTINPAAQTASSPEATPTASPVIPTTPISEASATPSSTPTPDVPVVSTTAPTPSPESPSVPAPEPSPTSSPTSSEPPPVSSPTPAPETPTVKSPPPVDSPVESMIKPPAPVRIGGRVKDANNNPIANAVVVLISPQGTVLASTTDEQGNYSFIVAASAQSYRLIPSRDGFTFEPVDRVLPGVSNDQKELDFIGAISRKP